MSTRSVMDCDRCGKEIPTNGESIVILNTGRELDAAGDSYLVQERVDLCPTCCHKAMYAMVCMVPRYAYERNKALARFLRGDSVALRLVFPAEEIDA